MRTVSFDQVINDREPLVLHRSDSTTNRFFSPLKEYHTIKETNYIMSSSEMMTRLRNAEKHIQEGKGIKINLDEL